MDLPPRRSALSAKGITQPRLTCPTCMSVFLSYLPSCPNDGARLEVRRRDPLEGMAFADRYVIESCIGEGGMGRVYRARHQHVSRRFAIKVLFGDFATDAKMRIRFEREAEAASQLDHPNVISVVDFGTTDVGQLYLVMDYAEGATLADIIERTGPLATERIVRLTLQMASGLAHAHEQKLVHRDFKGDNVIVVSKPDGEVARIVDFGLAIPQEPIHASPRLTADGLVMGTAEYMSPEQAVGEALDHRTDLFSLGVVLYEMLAGTLPFDGSPSEIIRANLSAEPPPIYQRVPGLHVDPSLEQLAIWLMRKKPAERPQTAQEVIRMVEARNATSAGAFAAGQGDSRGIATQQLAGNSWSMAGPPAAGPAQPAGAAPNSLPGRPVRTIQTLAIEPPGRPDLAGQWNGGGVAAGVPPFARPYMQTSTGLRRWRGWIAAAAIVTAVVVAAALVSPSSSNSDATEVVTTADKNTATGSGQSDAIAGRAADQPASAPQASAPAPVPAPEQPPAVAARDGGDGDAMVGHPTAPAQGRRSKPTNTRSAKAKKTGTQKTDRSTGRRRDKAAGTGGEVAQVSEQKLKAMYSRVGSAVRSSRDDLDRKTLVDLNDRYDAINLGNAMEQPKLRSNAMRTLREIERDLEAALKQQKRQRRQKRKPPARSR
ncbi:MAG: serine/threonine protein kinase [Proteobacteria bacterium]|nr:serine/threonine protein kinase [Pseudomonadota bacterium]